MAFGQGHQNPRESHVLHGRYVFTPDRSPLWHGARVRRSAGLHLSLNLTCPDRWIHVAYSVQAAYYLPMRVYMYKKRAWHYFLFDLCYYTNVLDLVFIWAMPSSAALFVACYCISLGSLASAVITWRNSLVFHDWDKVTSLFIHIYPPLVFSVIRCVLPYKSGYRILTPFQTLLSRCPRTVSSAQGRSPPTTLESAPPQRHHLYDVISLAHNEIVD